APALRPRVHEDDARRRAAPAGRAVQAVVQPGPDPGLGRRADVEVARQRRGPRRPRRPVRCGHRAAVPDVHGPVGPGRAVERTGIGGVHRFLNRLWTIARDPHGREPGDPDSGSLPAGVDEAGARLAIRQAAHRTLRDVTADYEAFHFNTLIAKLMEL